MIVDQSEGRLEEARAHADKIGLRDQLEKQLKYLAEYACQSDPERTRCLLYTDFAPMSFYFVMFKKKPTESSQLEAGAYPEGHQRTRLMCPDDGYERWFNGGLIFHGPHDNGGDGGAPTFSVNLTPQDGWSVHT